MLSHLLLCFRRRLCVAERINSAKQLNRRALPSPINSASSCLQALVGKLPLRLVRVSHDAPQLSLARLQQEALSAEIVTASGVDSENPSPRYGATRISLMRYKLASQNNSERLLRVGDSPVLPWPSGERQKAYLRDVKDARFNLTELNLRAVRFPTTYLTIGTLVGLVVGITMGLADEGLDLGGVSRAITGLGPAITWWVRLLTYLAAFMASAYVITAVLTARDRANVGRLAGIAALQHLVFIIIAATLTTSAGMLVHFFPEVDAQSLVVGFQSGSGANEVRAPTLSDRFTMMFENPVSAIMRANVLAIIVWSGIRSRMFLS